MSAVPARSMLTALQRHRRLVVVGALVVVVLVLVLVGRSYGPQLLSAWPLEEVKVTGVSDERRQAAVRKSLAEMLADENFFSVPLERVHERVSSLPWVASVTVERQWPNRLVLNVTERVPIAVWNNRALISRDGQLFHALDKYTTKKLPHLSGPENRLDRVMQYYHDIGQVLSTVGLNIRKLRVSRSLTAHVTLKNGIRVVVDREHYMSKLRRFVRFYRLVARKDSRMLARADLRYTTGLAVRWREDGVLPDRQERI